MLQWTIQLDSSHYANYKKVSEHFCENAISLILSSLLTMNFDVHLLDNSFRGEKYLKQIPLAVSGLIVSNVQC